MSTAVAVCHGSFGRVSVYRIDRPMALHAHREGHLIFKLSGSDAAFLVDDKTVQVNSKVAVAINPWQPHSFAPDDPEQGTCVLVLYVKPLRFLEAGHSAKNALRFGRPQVEVSDQIGNLVNIISALLMDEDEGSELLEGYVYELTRVCFNQSWQWVEGEALIDRAFNHERDYRIRNSIKLLNGCVGDEFVLDQIARQSGLSRPHFFKLFRQHLGITPNLYINILKTEKSVERLTTTSDAVTSIGFDLGFSSQASFTRFFTSNVGIPPTDYRRATMLLN